MTACLYYLIMSFSTSFECLELSVYKESLLFDIYLWNGSIIFRSITYILPHIPVSLTSE
jgi:hypothetical protein